MYDKYKGRKQNYMKKLLILMMSLILLAGCASSPKKAEGIETLRVAFVPSKDPAEIVTATKPLENLIKTTLAAKGIEVGKVEITVGNSYEAVGESLSAGSVDIGFIPAATYVLYQPDGVEVILAATRAGLSKDSPNAKDWNDGKETAGDSNNQVTYYRSLLIAGPSEKGQAFGAKVNAGTALTWEELSEANWCHSSTTSSAGYVYPTIWLKDNYQKGISDLTHGVQTQGYGDSAARLANGQCDIAVGFADFRRDFAEKWTTELARTKSIWEETNVIGVTDGIMNDTISISKNSPIMTDALIKALQEAFQEIAQTEEGAKAIAIYSHEGYKVVKDSDYDGARKAQDLVAAK